ncbi:Lrp/AsnC family transcriptional regulator [Castellaniella hirudinis]|uniref:Lrp/AsnC family transcriptional regulator n=1 Tax=Castellaniella hirudinis TaxID=1144617 RepID=UPI0039C2822E
MENPNLDSIDRRIVRILQRQADIGQAALAEQVGASPASCWRRIRRLEAAGILGPAVRLVDPGAVGRGLNVFCHIRLKEHNRQIRTEFEHFIESHEEVIECYSMSGEWDYLLRVVVEDMRGYERLLMEHFLIHEAVATSSSSFALKQVKYTTELPV